MVMNSMMIIKAHLQKFIRKKNLQRVKKMMMMMMMMLSMRN
jgi:hypothetical protein